MLKLNDSVRKCFVDGEIVLLDSTGGDGSAGNLREKGEILRIA
jgi:hypothetical protein